jgi:hypothetical protein
MSFKANLERKIKIDALFDKVRLSIGPLESGRKVDKEAVGRLLAMGSFEPMQARDLTLYILAKEADDKTILVLDNDLPIYQTTVEDVLLRKSPTVKEMISIRNAIRILNDSDVVVSKKETSAQTIRQLVIAGLDLTFDEADIDALTQEGLDALQSEDQLAMETTLNLFFSLLNYVQAPKAFRLMDYDVRGCLQTEPGTVLFGPMVIAGKADTTLKLIEATIAANNKAQVKETLDVMRGNRQPTLEGPAVFVFLADAVKAQQIWDAALL